MKPLKSLVFGKGLMISTLRGFKLITIRKYRADAHVFKKGELVIGIFMEGLSFILEITADTQCMPFGKLTDEASREDGFRNSNHAFQGLSSFYPGLKKTDTAGIIRFRVASIAGTQAVATNDYDFEPQVPIEL